MLWANALSFDLAEQLDAAGASPPRVVAPRVVPDLAELEAQPLCFNPAARELRVSTLMYRHRRPWPMSRSFAHTMITFARDSSRMLPR